MIESLKYKMRICMVLSFVLCTSGTFAQYLSTHGSIYSLITPRKDLKVYVSSHTDTDSTYDEWESFEWKNKILYSSYFKDSLYKQLVSGYWESPAYLLKLTREGSFQSFILLLQTGKQLSQDSIILDNKGRPIELFERSQNPEIPYSGTTKLGYLADSIIEASYHNFYNQIKIKSRHFINAHKKLIKSIYHGYYDSTFLNSISRIKNKPPEHTYVNYYYNSQSLQLDSIQEGEIKNDAELVHTTQIYQYTNRLPVSSKMVEWPTNKVVANQRYRYVLLK